MHLISEQFLSSSYIGVWLEGIGSENRWSCGYSVGMVFTAVQVQAGFAGRSIALRYKSVRIPLVVFVALLSPLAANTSTSKRGLGHEIGTKGR